MEKIAEKLNYVEPSIKFTYEKESNNTIPFMDIQITKSQNDLIFKVYRKAINKNYDIHVYFQHNNKIIPHKRNLLRESRIFFFRIFFHKYKHCIVWNWFIEKVILISPKYFFRGYSKR